MIYCKKTAYRILGLIAVAGISLLLAGAAAPARAQDVDPTPTDASSEGPTDTPPGDASTPTPTDAPSPTDAPPTDTPAPTSTPMPTGTPIPTDTPLPGETSTSTAVPSATETATDTPTPGATPTGTPTPTETAIPQHELLLKYNPKAPEQAIQHMLQALHAVEVTRIPEIGVMKVLVPDGFKDPRKARVAVQGSAATAGAGVTDIEVNGTRHIDVTTNDPLLGAQWALDSSAVGIQLGEAWGLAPSKGSGIVVAVVDTGVDYVHPDLKGQTVAGWDFVNDDGDPMDDSGDGHGTHVSGIIAAKTNNGIGVAGIAPNARIMPIKVCDSFGDCEIFEIAAGIVYAVDHGAKIINLSLSNCNGPSTTEQSAVDYALSKNVVVVAAAGNGTSGSVSCASAPSSYSYPASYPGVISVAAYDASGVAAAGYNHNDRITLAAPGIDITSTVPPWTTGNVDPYDSLSGTSMAAPMVSGVAALLMSQKVATTPATVTDALICGTRNPDSPAAPNPDPPYYDNFLGWGFLQADWSLSWRNNSTSCHVTLPNDNFENAMVITSPSTRTQAISSRTVTIQPSDPTLGLNPPVETVWYKFVPGASGNFQISTLGSDYDTLVGVFQGNQGALTQVAFGDDAASDPSFNGNTLVTAGLQKGLTYYIVVGTKGPAVDGKVLHLDIRSAMVNNAYDYQDNSGYVAYSGTWVARTSGSGRSITSVTETADNNALAAFTFRGGLSFYYARTVGPDRGSTEVWVDGVLNTTVGNRGAITLANQAATIALGAPGGSWHQVILRRSASGPGGLIDLDRVQTVDQAAPSSVITGLVDDRASTYISYLSPTPGPTPWSQFGFGSAYLMTVTQTTTLNASVVARFSGNAITIFRGIGPGYGSMDVSIDGNTPLTVPNTAGVSAYNVPYSITGLAATTHTLTLTNDASSTLQLDALQAATISDLPVNTNTDDRSGNLKYSGVWTNNDGVATAFGKTQKTTTDLSSRVDFTFSGNYLCIGYMVQSGGGTLDVTVDGVAHPAAIDTSVGLQGAQARWCSKGVFGAPGLLADTQHSVRLQPSGTGLFTLDHVQAMRYNTITPARGLINDTDASFEYDLAQNWTQVSNTRFNSKEFKRTTTITPTAFLDFYINGTGLILYTSVGQTQGKWQVFVDDSSTPWPVETMGTPDPSSYIDLFDLRFRPMAFGIVDLAPGIHKIELRAIVASLQAVDLDGVRVFP